MKKEKPLILLRDYNLSYKDQVKIKSTEKFFRQLEINKPILFREYKKTKSYINDTLLQKNYEQLFELIEYFDTDDGLGVVQYFSDMKRVYNIINIIKLEKELGLPYFCNGISDFDALLYKYIKLILYMRRLEMKLPANLQSEFFEYVSDNNISGVAIYTICHGELLAKDIRIGCAYYDGIKDKKQGIVFLNLLLKKYPGREEILIRVADGCLEQGDINLAHKYLKEVVQPSDTVQMLIEELEGAI